MPLRKARYYHKQAPKYDFHTKYSGFTILLEPVEYPGTSPNEPTAIDPHLVNVTVAWCSKVDHFCKREGRETCLDKAGEVIKVVDLPMFIAKCHQKLYGHRVPPTRAVSNSYAWIWKYFL